MLVQRLSATLPNGSRSKLEHLEPYCLSSALGDDLNSTLASELMKSIRAIDGEHSVIGVPYGTHASRIAAAGIPAAVFGPGDVPGAHQGRVD
jgi:acetylornithine deacetylase